MVIGEIQGETGVCKRTPDHDLFGVPLVAYFVRVVEDMLSHNGDSANAIKHRMVS